MRSLLRFHLGLFGLPFHLQLWVGVLVGANIVAPLFFLGHLEAQVALAAGLTSVLLMSALTGRYGFSRIVGLGHITWVPLLVFLVGSLPEVSATSGLGVWMRTLIVVDALSLGLDAIDAVRFLRGDRAETVDSLDSSLEAIVGPA